MSAASCGPVSGSISRGGDNERPEGGTKTVRKSITALIAMLSLWVMSVGVAVAQDADYGTVVDFGVSGTPESPAIGDTVTCSVVGAVAGDTLTWTAGDESGTVIAAADGTASFSFVLGTEVLGVSISGELSGDAATEVLAAVAGAEAGDDVTTEEDGLPQSGANTALLFGGGLLVLLLGGGALLAARRQKFGSDA